MYTLYFSLPSYPNKTTFYYVRAHFFPSFLRNMMIDHIEIVSCCVYKLSSKSLWESDLFIRIHLTDCPIASFTRESCCNSILSQNFSSILTIEFSSTIIANIYKCVTMNFRCNIRLLLESIAKLRETFFSAYELSHKCMADIFLPQILILSLT